MNKKYVIIGGSALVVIFLILGSLSNVVGYQSIKSITHESPLFKTRTQQVTNQEKYCISSQYLGQGSDSVPFPFRDNTTSMIQMFLNQIRTMEEYTFRKFVQHHLRLLIQQGTVKYPDAKDIEKGFFLLRENSKLYDDSTNLIIGNYTWRVTPTICWFPGCFLLFSFVVFLLTIGFHCFPTEKICMTAFSLPLMKNYNFI